MYQKGEYIIYGSTGVCRVEDVAVPDNIPIKEKGALYYKLSPVYGAGSIYTVSYTHLDVYKRQTPRCATPI